MLPGPDPGLRAVVVVPARDEAQRIGACVTALADQTGLAAAAYEVLLVLDRCTDRTRALALVAAGLNLRLLVIDSPTAGA
jgi:glucosyl-3-phosphoglycerate synthase